MASTDYKELSAIARRRRDHALIGEASLSADKLARLCKDVTGVSQDLTVFSQDEIEIINSEPEDIVLKIRQNIWTALEVTEAFCKSAAIAQQLVRTSDFLTSLPIGLRKCFADLPLTYCPLTADERCDGSLVHRSTQAGTDLR